MVQPVDPTRSKSMRIPIPQKYTGQEDSFNNTYTAQKSRPKINPRSYSPKLYKSPIPFVVDAVNTKNTGTGTTSNPFKATQPDKSLVSPYLKSSISFISDTMPKQDYSYIGYSPDGKPIHGPVQPTDPNDLENNQTSNQVFLVPLSLSEFATTPKNHWDSIKQSNMNILRYSDAVDNDKLPKPSNILENLNYYASHGLKPIYNIPLYLAGVKGTSPTLSDTVMDTGLDLILEGKTKTHDPVGDYIRKDPLRTLVQLPAEAALWVTGAKAIALASRGIKTISPLAYQTLKFPINNKMKSVYRGITMNNNPIFGIQNGKLVKGFDETKLPFRKIDPENFNRYGWESTQSSGIADKTIFAEKTLDNMVERKIITTLDKERIDTFKNLYEITKGVKSETGKFSSEPINLLTQKQSDYLLNYAKLGQKKGTVDTLHGSTALQPQISQSLRTQAGSHLKLGDLDLVPKANKLKDIPKVASKLIQGLKDFPLEKGQSIKIVDDVTSLKDNKELLLITKGKSKPDKILEVVLEERNASGTDNLVRMGDKVLGQKIQDTKIVKTKDFSLNIHTRRFQLQENMRTALGFHKGDDTLFNVYASGGRSKDIVRSYWNFKEDAIRVGGKKGKEIDTKAEHLRSLYESKSFRF